MTTNATVEEQHKDEAKLSWINPDDMDAYERRFAQALANLEAARAENADLTNRLAEIDAIAKTCGLSASPWISHRTVAALASGHTPSPCPGCAAKDAEIAIWQGKAETFGRACAEKDEAMAEQLGALIQTQIMLDNMVHHKSVCWSEVHDRIIANREVLPKAPPADPVVAIVDELWELDGVTTRELLEIAVKRGLELSRLGGAK